MSFKDAVLTLLSKLVVENDKQKKEIMMNGISKLHDSKQLMDMFIKFYINYKGENRENVLKLIMHCSMENPHFFDEIQERNLFEQFKILMTEPITNFEYEDYMNLEKLLETMLGHLSSFSPQTLFTSIFTWSTNFKDVALAALSRVCHGMKPKCISSIFGQTFVPTDAVAAAVSAFCEGSKLENMEEEVKNNFYSKLFEDVKTKIQKELLNNKSAITIFGSLLNFIDKQKASELAENFQKELLSASNINYEFREEVCKALANLPIVNENGSHQFNIFKDAFIGITISKYFLEFSKDRFVYTIMNDSITEYGQMLTLYFGANCSEFQNKIFNDINAEKSEMICEYAMLYKDNLNGKEKELLKVCIQNQISSLKEISQYVNPTSLGEAICEIPLNDLNYKLLSSTIINKDIKFNKKSITNERFIESFLNLSCVYIKKIYQDKYIIPIFEILSASFEGRQINKINPIPTNLCEICDLFINSEISNDLVTAAINDSRNESAVLAAAVNSDTVIPESILSKLSDENTFIEFFAATSKRNIVASLTQFVKIVKDKYVKEGSKSFFEKLGVVSQKKWFSSEVIFEAARRIIESDKFNSRYSKQICQVAETVFSKCDEAVLMFELLARKSENFKLSVGLSNTLLTSPEFCKILPEIIPISSGDIGSACVSNWYNYGNKERDNEFAIAFIECGGFTKLTEICIQFNFDRLLAVACSLYDVIQKTPTLDKTQSLSSFGSTSMNNIKNSQSVGSMSKTTLDPLSNLLLYLFDGSLDSNEERRRYDLTALLHIAHDNDITVDFEVPYSEYVNYAKIVFKSIIEKVEDRIGKSIVPELCSKSTQLYSAIALEIFVGTGKYLKDEVMEGLVRMCCYEHAAIREIGKRSLKTFLEKIGSNGSKAVVKKIIRMEMDNKYGYYIVESFDNNIIINQLLNACIYVDYNNEKQTLAVPIYCAIVKQKKIDNYKLLWGGIGILGAVIDSGELSASMENELSNSITQIFENFGVEAPTMSGGDFSSVLNSCTKIAQYAMKLDINNLENLFTTELFMLKSNEIIPLSWALFSARIIKGLIRYGGKCQHIIEIAANLLGNVTSGGRQSTCARTCATLSSLFTSADYSRFGKTAQELMLRASLNALTTPREFRVESVQVMCDLLEGGEETLPLSDRRVFDSLMSSFEVSESVGLERLLRGIKAFAVADKRPEKFANMSQMSIPRFLVIASESGEGSILARDILMILSDSSEWSDVFPGLARSLGMDQLCDLAAFFVERAKDSISQSPAAMELICALVEATGVRAGSELGRKLVSALVPVMEDPNSPTWADAVDILCNKLQPL